MGPEARCVRVRPVRALPATCAIRSGRERPRADRSAVVVRGFVLLLFLALTACPKPKCGARACTSDEVCMHAQVYEKGTPIADECVPLPTGCRDCPCAESAAYSRAEAIHPVCGAVPYRPLCTSGPPNLAVRIECAY